jgi:hypothetical protein
MLVIAITLGMKSPLERKSETNPVSSHERDVQMLVDALTPVGRSADLPTRSGSKPIPGTPQAVDAAFNQIVARLTGDLQRHLDTLVGKDFGPEINGELSKAITRLLKRLGCSVECPHCGKPATVRYTVYDKHRGPQFKYEHYPGSRHGGTRHFGALRLMPHANDWGQNLDG